MSGNEFLDDFHNDDGSWPNPYRPAPGDFIHGEVLEYGTFSGQYGEVPTVTIRAAGGTEDGADLAVGERYSLFISGDVLKGKFEQLGPRPGETVAIKRVEDGYSKNFSRNYKNWVVRVDRPFGHVPDFANAPGGDGPSPEEMLYANPAQKEPVSLTDPDDDLPF